MDSSNLNNPRPPLENRSIIDELIGKSIKGISRYIWLPPSDAAQECELPPHDVFGLAAGPAIISLDQGPAIGVSHDESLLSVVIWLIPDPTPEGILHDLGEEDAWVIDACDPQFGDSRFSAAIGGTVISVQLYQDRDERANLASRPREVALKLVLDSHEGLVFSFGLDKRACDSFAISTAGDLPAGCLDSLQRLI